MKIHAQLLGLAYVAAVALLGCGPRAGSTGDASPDQDDLPRTVAGDVEFLSRYDPALAVLRNDRGMVLVSPRYQGKVFTSAIGGEESRGRGWINYPELARDTLVPHMNAYGGENRMWLGPEGGQHSIFFAPGVPFEFANWQTPASIDSEAWEVTERSAERIALRTSARLENYSGSVFQVSMQRVVSLLGTDDLSGLLPPGLERYPSFGYRTVNSVVNGGDRAWTRETGTISIWILDMFSPGDSTVILVPYHGTGTQSDIVRSDYFGDVPQDRLRLSGGVVLFRADGKERGKIGLPGKRATGLAGSVDLATGAVTLVRYETDSTAAYLRQEWKIHEEPYTGDAVNAYNDGPLDDGTQMGPFYEIESNSPAAFLAPGEELRHVHSVMHLEVPPDELPEVLKAVFGVDYATLNRFVGT